GRAAGGHRAVPHDQCGGGRDGGAAAALCDRHLHRPVARPHHLLLDRRQPARRSGHGPESRHSEPVRGILLASDGSRLPVHAAAPAAQAGPEAARPSPHGGVMTEREALPTGLQTPMAPATPARTPAALPAPWSALRRRLKPRAPDGLSSRLLLLTVAFTLAVAALIIVPSAASFQERWLMDRLQAAELASVGVEALPYSAVEDSTAEQL